MTVLKRLRWATATVAAVAASVAVGTTVFGDISANKPVTPAKPVAAPAKLVDETAKTVFTDRTALAYKQPDGSIAFAWQLKPALTAAPPRPKDVAVLIDTSASQAGDPMRRAAQIVQALTAQLGADDRVDVWSVNLNHKEHTRSLTGGFKPADDKAVKKAADVIVTEEYAAGAVDLKAGIEQVLGGFDQTPGRQQIVLYVGDGESAAGAPLTEAVRPRRVSIRMDGCLRRPNMSQCLRITAGRRSRRRIAGQAWNHGGSSGLPRAAVRVSCPGAR